MFKRVAKWSGIALALFVLYVLAELRWPSGPIKVSRETTFITAPLADDGLPNYSEYLLDQMRAGVTPENNGAIPFIQATWPAGLWDLEVKQLVCAELGMELPTEEGLDSPYLNQPLMAELREWCGGDTEPEPEAEMAEDLFAEESMAGDESDDDGLGPDYELLEAIELGPWTAEEAAPIARWLKEHAAHFDLLYEAVERDKFYYPSPTLLADSKACLIDARYPGAQKLRTTANCLQLRANLRLGSGDIRGAWDDCRVMYQLADVSTHPTVLCELVAQSREQIANAQLLRVLESPELTPELADEIATFLASRRPQHNMRQTLETGNRVEYLTALLQISDYRPRELTDLELMLRSHEDRSGQEPSIDWTTVLRIVNREYERYLEAVDQPTYAKQEAAIDEWCDEIAGKAVEPHWTTLMLSRKARTNLQAYEFELSFPIDSRFLRESRRNLAFRELHQTAAALSRYHLATGEYPESLDPLMPEYLDKLPIDPFDRPIVYQRTSDGYLLYSLGPNGQDDHGSGGWGILQGYRIPDRWEEEVQLRQRLGEPVPDEEGKDVENDDVLVIDERADSEQQADDIAIRLPLIQKPIPKFEREE